jgi:hypothetical protein
MRRSKAIAPERRGRPLLHLPEKIILEPYPVSGWVLKPSIMLDAANPLLGYLMTCSTLKRQTAFLCMSLLLERGADDISRRFVAAGLCDPGADHNPLAVIARCLVTARAQEIAQAIVGEKASTLVRLLHRIGNGALPKESYEKLLRMIASSEHCEKASVLLNHGCPISDVSLEAAFSLPSQFLRPEIITRIQSTSQLSQLRCALDLIMSLMPQDQHEQILQSLENLSPATPLGPWLVRLLEWVPKFQVVGPLPDDEEVRLLNSPEALKTAGSRFRNCLKSKIPVVALGRVVYYEWLCTPHIVEIQVLSRQQYLFKAIYGPRNHSVTADTLRTISAKFQEAGVLVPAQFAEFRRINACANLLSVYEYGNPDPDDDGEVLDLAQIEDAA